MAVSPKTSPLEAAKQMLDWHQHMKLRPIPLHGKDPFLRNFGRPHLREITAEDFVEDGELLNIGWQMGPPSNGLCDLDIDTTIGKVIWDAIAVYEDIDPFIFGKDEFIPSHIMFRITGRPENHHDSRIEARIEALPYPKDGKMRPSAYDWRLGGYNGQTDTDGTPFLHQIQTFAHGVHPGTEQPLCWHKPLENPEDIPTIDWEQAKTLFLELCRNTGAAIKMGRTSPAPPTTTYSSNRQPPQNLNLQTLTEYKTRKSWENKNRGICPFCGDNSFSINQDTKHTGICHHHTSCPSKQYGTPRGGVATEHLLAYLIKIDTQTAKEWLQKIEAYEITPTQLLTLPHDYQKYPLAYGKDKWEDYNTATTT